jgi:hypothetical protein
MNEARAAAESGESREEFISRVMEEDGEVPEEAGGKSKGRKRVYGEKVILKTLSRALDGETIISVICATI